MIFFFTIIQLSGFFDVLSVLSVLDPPDFAQSFENDEFVGILLIL